MYNIMLVSGVRILVLSLWVKLSSTEDFKISHIRLLVLYNNNNESESQSCLILWDLMDCNLPHSSVCGILKARIFEWVAISFFRGSSWPRIKPRSAALQVDSLPSEPPGKPLIIITIIVKTTPSSSASRADIYEKGSFVRESGLLCSAPALRP